jgi:hypothetical protein
MNSDLAAQKAFDQLARVGFEKLTSMEKILAAVWTFEAGVSNNGFASYFSSSKGDMAFYVPTALRTIGAVDMAELATKANDVFGAGGPPGDRKKRRAAVRAFGDEIRRTLTSLESRYYESRDDVDALLDLYINKRP